MYKFVKKIIKKRALKSLIQLGAQLVIYYGKSNTYTPGQLRRVMEEANTPTRYKLFGYAIFLSANDYEEINPSNEETPSYEDIRMEISNLIFSGDTKFSNSEGLAIPSISPSTSRTYDSLNLQNSGFSGDN